LSHELPVVVEAVDDEEKIRSLIPQLREIVGKELMTIQAVEII
jgi:PII-like signaling protein